MLRKLTVLVAAFLLLSSTAALAASRYDRDDPGTVISDQTVSVVNSPQPNVRQPVQAPENTVHNN